ncbi:MAG TPA: hypothetical protein VGF60_17980 [Xanthobacteraceae bacterium]
MSVILLTLGIVVAAAGIVAVGFGIPINEIGLGIALISAGTTALVGGLLLVGLAAVVSELGRVTEGVRLRAAPRPGPRPEAGEAAGPADMPISASGLPMLPSGVRPVHDITGGRPRPEAPAREIRPAEAHPAAGPSPVDVSAAAIERLRSSIPRGERGRSEPPVVADLEEAPLSPNGATAAAAPVGRRAGEAAPAEPRPAAEDRTASAAAEALKASRLEFLFRSRSARRASQAQPENFDTFWPADARPGRAPPAEGQPQPRAEEVERQAEAAPPTQQPRAEASADDRRPAAILKSGVVDGMAYTLYADGSIEAKLPQGTVRFGSIAELRAHIESNS